jgi:hypothetical protein
MSVTIVLTTAHLTALSCTTQSTIKIINSSDRNSAFLLNRFIVLHIYWTSHYRSLPFLCKTLLNYRSRRTKHECQICRNLKILYRCHFVTSNLDIFYKICRYDLWFISIPTFPWLSLMVDLPQHKLKNVSAPPSHIFPSSATVICDVFTVQGEPESKCRWCRYSLTSLVVNHADSNCNRTATKCSPLVQCTAQF